jgi:hypothetical protein
MCMDRSVLIHFGVCFGTGWLASTHNNSSTVSTCCRLACFWQVFLLQHVRTLHLALVLLLLLGAVPWHVCTQP